MKIKAFSKINLFLNVMNDFHEHIKKHKLEGVFVLCKKYFDVIHIKKSNNFSVRYFNSKNNQILFKNDSVKRVYDWFLKRFKNLNLNFEIKIKKGIPVGSGLGGESSDAAQIIKFITKVNKIKINDEMLEDIALNLGSDICFFLYNYNFAYITEYGNNVRKMRNFNFNYQLFIFPKIKCDTKEVFRIFDKLSSAIPSIKYGYDYMNNIFRNHDWDLLINNLTNSAFIYSKKLESVYLFLLEKYKDSKIILTGSGSSIVRIKRLW